MIFYSRFIGVNRHWVFVRFSVEAGCYASDFVHLRDEQQLCLFYCSDWKFYVVMVDACFNIALGTL